MAKNQTSFSKENQPITAKRGHKQGVKIDSLQVYKYLQDTIEQPVEKTTPLMTKILSAICSL